MTDFVSVDAIFWRMLSIRWQQKPLESGSHITGQRFNRLGQRAMYFGIDHASAIDEFHQSVVRPGTLAGYRIVTSKVADLRDRATLAALGVQPADLDCEWRAIAMIDRGVPPSWNVADRAIAAGAVGAIVPSFQQGGGTNLVLWSWHDAALGGEGAAVTLQDPHGELHSA
jgi:RES domain-containing protein